MLGPRIQFSNGLDGFGESTSIPQGRVENTFQGTDTLAWSKGGHNVKFGADVYRYQLNSWASASGFSAYTFNNWNDFAAGNPVSFAQYFGSTMRGYRVTNQAYYVQDDWRIGCHLTVNLGLRAEQRRRGESPALDLELRSVHEYQPDVAVPATGRAPRVLNLDAPLRSRLSTALPSRDREGAVLCPEPFLRF